MYNILSEKIKGKKHTFAGKRFMKAISRISSAITKQKKNINNNIELQSVALAKTSELVESAESKEQTAGENLGGALDEDTQRRMREDAEVLRGEAAEQRSKQIDIISDGENSKSNIENLENKLDNEGTIRDATERGHLIEGALTSMNGEATQAITNSITDFDVAFRTTDKNIKEVSKLGEELKHMSKADINPRGTEKLFEEKSKDLISKIDPKKLMTLAPEQLQELRKEED